MRRFALAFVLLWPLRAAAAPSAFELFQKFCIATGGDPAAVKVAVEAAGGEQRDLGETSGPWPMTVRHWELGSKLILHAGTWRTPQTEYALGIAVVNCGVIYSADKVSLTAARNWADTPSKDGMHFTFRDADGRHEPVSLENGLLPADSWTLTVSGDSEVGAIDLTHYLPAGP